MQTAWWEVAYLYQLKASVAGFYGKALEVLTSFPSFLNKHRHKGVGKRFQQFLLPMSHTLLGLELCKYTSLSPWVAFTTNQEIFNKVIFVMKVEQDRVSKKTIHHSTLGLTLKETDCFSPDW